MFPLRIPFSRIPSVPLQIRDLLKNTPDLLAGIPEQILKKKASYPDSNRQLLVSEIRKQYEGIQLCKEQEKNLQLLEESSTFTVCTGHQLNLATGSVFFIYKILQTIKTAKELSNKYPETPVIPIFWMATEDHDFEEIRSFQTLERRYSVSAPHGGPVGRILLEDLHFLCKIEQDFQKEPFGKEIIKMLKEAYLSGRSLSLAIRHLCQKLFGKMGLLCLDGDSHALKRAASFIFARELKENLTYNVSQPDTQRILKDYGKLQVNPREINLFYMETPSRQRIEKTGIEGYRLVETGDKFSEKQMQEVLEKNPEKISPNALLRPVYQEFILPNLAYIGGNAEVVYWQELPLVFQALEIPFPLVIPRNSILFLAEKHWRWAKERNINPEDLILLDKRNFANRYLDPHPELEQELDKMQQIWEENFASLLQKASSTAPMFGDMVRAEKARQTRSLLRMKKRLARAERIRQKDRYQSLENLYENWHPTGIWQERLLNFSEFYRLKGADWLIEVYEILNPHKAELIIEKV